MQQKCLVCNILISEYHFLHSVIGGKVMKQKILAIERQNGKRDWTVNQWCASWFPQDAR